METITGDQIDPLEDYGLSEILNNKSSYDKYKRTWLEFVAFAKISASKPPIEDDFYEYFIRKKDRGVTGQSCRMQYSHLNKFYSHLYKENLSVSQYLA